MSHAEAEARKDAALGFGPPYKPNPPKFPMKFKVFLRRIFGGRLHADRLRLFRKFAFEELRSQQLAKDRELTPEAAGAAAEVMRDKLIADLNRDGIHDLNWLFRTTERIALWRPSNRINQRRDANSSRWLKENRKKILAILHRRISDISHAEKCSLAKLKAKKVTGSHRKK